MIRTLFKKELKSNYRLILIFMAVLSMYGSMVTYMFQPEMAETFLQYQDSLSGFMSAFGMMGIPGSLVEFLANYLYGFIFIAFPVIYIIVAANKLVAKYTDSGSMAYLLSTGKKRRSIIITQAVFLGSSVFLLILFITLLCISVSAVMFPGELEVGKFLILNAGLLSLHLFFSGICFCSSCLFDDSKYAVGTGAGITIAFVLLKMISQVGDAAGFLKYLTPITLFDTQGLIDGKMSAYAGMAGLYLMALLFYAAGGIRFCKRDIAV